MATNAIIGPNESLCDTEEKKKNPAVLVSTYLVSEFAVFKEPQLVLPVEIVPINVAEVHLQQKTSADN